MDWLFGAFFVLMIALFLWASIPVKRVLSNTIQPFVDDLFSSKPRKRPSDDGTSRMNDATRNQIAEALETLAAQPVWNDEVWKHCYELVSANMNDSLVAYVHDDLIHCSAEPLFRFRNPPTHPDFDSYKQEFRDVAEALRTRMSLAEAQKKFGL
jgi:hypothetical protein